MYTTAHRFDLSVALLLTLIAVSTPSLSAAANLAPHEVRVASAIGKFGDTHQVAAAYRFRAPRALKVHHLELAVGVLTSAEDSRPLLSFGPVWRLPFGGSQHYVELGFSPTLIGGAHFDGRDLGGVLHFTSSLTIGTRLGRGDRFALALRAQHTSNGGLNGDNPGLDMLGLNLALEF